MSGVRTQIFGWTAPALMEGETYVRYVMAFRDGNSVSVEVRGGDGKSNNIDMPVEDARELALALTSTDL